MDVVERLSNVRPGDARHRAERDTWLGAAYACTGDSVSALRLLDRALTVLKAPEELYYAALFQKAHALWMDREWEPLETLVAQLLDAPFALFRGRGYLLRAWIHIGKDHDAHAQSREYLRALDHFESMPQPDMRVRLSTLMSLSALARELGLESVAQRVRTAYEGMHPTSGMEVHYFKITRILGWIDALEGNELAACRRFRRAAESAPSDLWRVECLADRATLARATGERAFALDQLYAAHDLASRLSWNDAVEEDRLTLLNLAELFGDVDAGVAQRYLAQFRSLRTPMDRRMGYASDERVRALEAYPSGIALLRLGEAQAARQMLAEAYKIFAKFDYGWRAALAALGMHKATQDAHWLGLARKGIKRWPKSWIAREVRDAQSHPASDEGAAGRAPERGHRASPRQESQHDSQSHRGDFPNVRREFAERAHRAAEPAHALKKRAGRRNKPASLSARTSSPRSPRRMLVGRPAIAWGKVTACLAPVRIRDNDSAASFHRTDRVSTK